MTVERLREGFHHLGFVFLLFFSSKVMASSGITYQGRLLDPSGVPVTSSSVQFKMQIRSPGAEDCLMYEELQTQDLSLTSGVFAISLKDGTGTRTDSNSWSLFEALSNRQTFTFASSDCNGPNTYTPSATDNRIFRVFFDVGSGWESLPAQVMNYIPMSIESYAVGGFPAKSLFRVEDSGVLGNVSALTTTQYNNLVSLANGTSSAYEKSGELGGSALPPLTNGQTMVSDGSGGWSAMTPLTSESDPNVSAFAKTSLPTCGAGEVLKSDGSALSCVTDTSGTLPNVGTAGTYTKVTTDAQGRVTSGSQIDGDDITSGTIGGSTSVLTTGDVTADQLSAHGLYLSNLEPKTISLLPPASITADYTLTFPIDDGANGQVLTTNGSGVLSWSNPSTGSVTSVTGTSPISVDNTNPATPVITLSNSGVGAGTYGSATEVPVFSVDATGRVTSVTDTAISLGISNLKTSLGAQQWPTTSCTTGQTLTWTSITDALSCSSISITTSQVSDFPDLDASYFKQGGNSFSAAATLGTNDNNALNFETNGSPRMTIDESGYVGIGTTAPAAVLDIFSDGSSSTIKVQRTNNAQKANVGLIPAGTISSSNASWIFGMDSNSNDFRISSWDGSTINVALSASNQGMIGIGTTSPNTELVVASEKTSQIRGITSLNVSSSGWAGQFTGLSARGTISSPTYPQSGDSLATYAAGGKNGSTDYRSGYLFFSADSDHTSSSYETSAYLRLTDSGNTTPVSIMTWKPSGHVGIGTEEPSEALEVVGTIKATGFEGPLTSTSTSIGDGSSASPSMTFTSDPNTGFYSSGADQIGISAGGSQVWNITTSGIISPTAGGALVSSSAGTASAPTFSFSGDSDTGWFSPGADTLAASTAGTERMRIDDSGNVGIGTTSATNRLTVSDAASVPSIFTRTYSDNLMRHALSISRKRADATAPSAGFGPGLAFSAEGFTNDSIGSVGRISAIWENNQTNDTTDRDSALLFYTSTDDVLGEALRISSGGNVGIGTTSPSDPLHIYSTSTLGTIGSFTLSNAIFRVQEGATGSLYMDGNTLVSDIPGGLMFGSNDSSAPLIFIAGGNEKMRISSTGNVGIGTTAPGEELEIRGAAAGIELTPSNTSGVNGLIRFNNSTEDGEGGLFYNENNDSLNLMRSISTSAINGVAIGSTGKVGIGTSQPSHPLHIELENGSSSSSRSAVLRIARITPGTPSGTDTPAGGIRFDVENAAGTPARVADIWAEIVDLTAGSEDGTLTFSTVKDGSSVDRMRIDESGNVGIGTTSPIGALQVGNALIVNSEQGGAIEIGGFNTISNPVVGGTPYLDFHYGTGSAQDYNFRLINVADNRLDFKTASGKIPLTLSDGNVGIGTTNPTQKFQVGASGDGTVAIANAWNTFSDIRLKKNITPIRNACEMVDQLNGYYYNWKYGKDQSRQVGVIAQEVQQVLPELVSEGSDGILTVDYPKLSAVLIEAVKEIRRENQFKDEVIKQLKNENSEIKAYLCSKDPQASFCH